MDDKDISCNSLCQYSDVAEKRIRITKTKQELDDLDNETTDIFKSNIIQRYTIRPASIPIIDNLCLAQFAAYYK